MVFRAICVASVLSCLPVAGCGTVANLASPGPVEGGKTPFGGVRHDVSCINKAANGESAFGICPGSGSDQRPRVAPLLLCAADLPLSFIGDVVTWPYTASYTWINQPVPVPPMVPAPTPPPQPYFAPGSQAPVTKTPQNATGDGGQKADKLPKLPTPLPSAGS